MLLIVLGINVLVAILHGRVQARLTGSAPLRAGGSKKVGS
jgi:hypothetical protein